MSQPEQPVKGSADLTAAIVVAAVVVIFMAFAIVLVFYLCAKRFWGANPILGRARLALADEDAAPRRGLDPAAIKALPSMVFRREEFKDGLECAVCLSELSEGEEARLLPSCRHGFHLECIDMWLHSHSTCPLCRSLVSSESADSGVESGEASPVEAVLAAGRLPESPILPTNVLFGGFQEPVGGLAAAAVAAGSCEGSSSSVGSSSGKPEGKLVIEIPKRVMEGCQAPVAPLQLSRLPVDDIKSPTSARMRSLRTLRSHGNRGVGSSCCPRGGGGGGGDIEQGVVGLGIAVDGSLQIPRTPMTS